MPETLLQTKLYIPPLRPNLVPRPRLIERLNQGLERNYKLTLICASAGFGKSTVVTGWRSPLSDFPDTVRGDIPTLNPLSELRRVRTSNPTHSYHSQTGWQSSPNLKHKIGNFYFNPFVNKNR